MIDERFLTPEESALSREFLDRGYVIRDVEDRPALDGLRTRVAGIASDHLGLPAAPDTGDFLDRIHERVKPAQLNELRLKVFRTLNDWPDMRPTYHAIGRRSLATLVGNELAMQNRVNLSVQMPRDDSSLLDIHSDVYGGETPFQVVQWLPLVDVARTKSMFILPPAKTDALARDLHHIGEAGMQAVFDRAEPDLVWLDIPYGKVLIFASHCLHGNVINKEPGTRWSLNCRFTGLFTPYTSYEKKLGSFYLPITMRAATRFGLDYEPPAGFAE